MKTSAVVFIEKGRVQLQKIKLPDLRPDDVLIRAHCSGVSVGTDGWVLTNQFTWGGDIPYPVVPGYQRAGWVEAVGSEVKSIKVGQRVAATISRLEGNITSNWGGHVHHGVTPQNEVYPLGEKTSFANAAQLVVAQVGYNAALRSGVGHGRTVLVLGDGCIGQMAAQSARAMGAHVILAGHRADRIELARQHSADEVLQTKDSSWLKRLESNQSPVSAVIDTVQSESFFHEYAPHLRGRTDVVLSGFSPGGFHVDMGEMQKREIGVLTMCGWTRERNEATLAFMEAGQINFEALLTHHLPAADAGNAYGMIQAKSEPFLGVNILWEEGAV